MTRRAASPAVAERSRLALIARIGHPKWSPADDLRLLRKRAAGHDFSMIADWMRRPVTEVQQRWHRLRIIPAIRARLAELRPADTPYPQIGGET